MDIYEKGLARLIHAINGTPEKPETGEGGEDTASKEALDPLRKNIKEDLSSTLNKTLQK